MPIITSTPPAEAIDALEPLTGSRLSNNSQLRNAVLYNTFGRSLLQEGVPHLIFELRSDTIRSNSDLDAAQEIGWRYLGQNAGSVPFSSIEIKRNSSTGNYELAAIVEGPLATETLEAIDRLNRDPEVVAGDFEPRMLRVSALYVVALWLRERQTKQDIFLPLANTNPMLEDRKYNATEFMHMLTLLASKRAAQRAANPGDNAAP